MQAEILDLFPTAVVRHSVNVQPWLDQLKSTDMQHRGSHSYSVTAHLLDDYSDLALILEQCATDYSQQVLALKGTQRIQTSWLNHSQGEDFTHEHVHSNALVAMCLYLDLPGGQDRIRFHKHDPRGWGIYNMMFDPDPERAAQSPWAKTTVEVPVKNGDLLLWPAWLLHSVPPTNSSGSRWTLAANTMPEAGWGSLLHEYRVS